MNKYPVAKASEVKENSPKIVEVKGVEVGIYYVDGEFHAYANYCPHAAAPACKGMVVGTRLPSHVYEYKYGRDREILRCPWHGWEFDLKTGEHLVDSGVKLRKYPLEQDGDDIYLLLNR